jgi:hypothetical protein
MNRRSVLAALGGSISIGGCQSINQGGVTPVSSPPTLPTRYASVTDIRTPSADQGFRSKIAIENRVINDRNTARLKLSLTNISDRGASIKSHNLGYTLGLRKSNSNESPVVILRKSKADPDIVRDGCWGLLETSPPDAVRDRRLESGETIESVRYLYSAPWNESRCLQPGDYSFQRGRPAWSFIIKISG